VRWYAFTAPSSDAQQVSFRNGHDSHSHTAWFGSPSRRRPFSSGNAPEA
jgi:hypothetical protein